MNTKPLMSIQRDGDTLVVRCPLALHPRLPQLYDALLRSAGHTHLARAAFAVLVQAIFLCAPTLEDAEQALDADDSGPMSVH